MNDQQDDTLAQPLSSFDEPTDEVKAEVGRLVREGSAEAKDKLVQLAQDRGINVLPAMCFEEIQDKFSQAL